MWLFQAIQVWSIPVCYALWFAQNHGPLQSQEQLWHLIMKMWTGVFNVVYNYNVHTTHLAHWLVPLKNEKSLALTHNFMFCLPGTSFAAAHNSICWKGTPTIKFSSLHYIHGPLTCKLCLFPKWLSFLGDFPRYHPKKHPLS